MLSLRLWRGTGNDKLDVLRKSRLTAGFTCLIAFLIWLIYTLVDLSGPTVASGRTHIKTFSFWSSHPLATVGSGLVVVKFYALHLDVGCHSLHLDFCFCSHGFGSFN